MQSNLLALLVLIPLTAVGSGCSEFIATPKTTSMKVVNRTSAPVTVDAIMADTQSRHKETFYVAANDSQAKSWKYYESGSGLNSAWEQQVNATIKRPNFYLVFGWTTFTPDMVIWLKGDARGVTKLSPGVGGFATKLVWADADKAMEYAVGDAAREPEADAWKPAQFAAEHTFHEDGDTIIEGSTWVVDEDGFFKQ